MASKGFEKILKDTIDGNVKEVVCTHKDRLCRFGFELVEMIFQRFGVSLIMIHTSNGTKSQDYQQELAEDLLAIVNVFVAKNNGKRASENRKRRKKEEEESKKKTL